MLYGHHAGPAGATNIVQSALHAEAILETLDALGKKSHGARLSHCGARIKY